MIPAANRSSIVAATKNGQQIFELILDNWGNRGTLADADLRSVIYPALATDAPLPTVVGMAISPRSDIDRCVVTYNVNPLDPLIRLETFQTNLSPVLLNDQIISVDRPWIGEMDAGRLLIAGNPPGAPTIIPSLFIHCDPGQQFGDQYAPDGAASPAIFGTNLEPEIFTAPTLRLLLFLNGTPPVPQRRSPGYFAGSLDPDPVNPGPVAKTLLKVVNVQGRRKIRVMARRANPAGGGTVNITVGGVRGFLPSGSAVASCQECTLITSTELDPNEGFCQVLDTPQVDFLTIYVQRVGATATSGASFIVDFVD